MRPETYTTQIQGRRQLCVSREKSPYHNIRGRGRPPPSPKPSLLVRETVGSRTLLVSELAMFESRGCMLLGFVVLADIVMMGRLMVMMRGGVMVSGRLVVMFARRMLH